MGFCVTFLKMVDINKFFIVRVLCKSSYSVVLRGRSLRGNQGVPTAAFKPGLKAQVQGSGKGGLWSGIFSVSKELSQEAVIHK